MAEQKTDPQKDPLNTARLQAALSTLESKLANETAQTTAAPAPVTAIPTNDNSVEVSKLEQEVHTLKAQQVAARKLIDHVLHELEQHV